MNDPGGHSFDLAGAALVARASGALHWPAMGLLVVADLHLGKAQRIARGGGGLLPPYGDSETLARLEAEIAATAPARVVCLGDSFDDAAGAMAPEPATAARLARMATGRVWIWVSGNHDPGPGTSAIAGAVMAIDWQQGALRFRHIAAGDPPPVGTAEVSGHFHPKARLALGGARVSRPCFLIDAGRAILPAFGVYTGGLAWSAPELVALMQPGARAVLTGARAVVVPMPAPSAAD